MTEYVVNVAFAVDSAPLQAVDKELVKVKDSMGKATKEAAGTNKIADGFGKVQHAVGAARGGVAGIGAELLTMGQAGLAAINPVTAALLAAAAAGLVAVTVFKSVVTSLTEIHKINDIAETIGISADKITEFAAAMAYHGAALEDTQQILLKFSGNITKAVEDSESLAAAFAKVGQSPRALAAMNDPVEAFIESAKGLREIEDVNQRNAVSFELFGQKASGVLKELADYERALDKQYQLGNVASEERLALASRQDEAFKQIKASGDSLKNTLVDIFGDSTTQIVEDFADTLEVIALLFRSMIPLIKVWADGQLQAFRLIKIALSPVMAQYMAMYNLMTKVGLLSDTINKPKRIRGGAPMAESFGGGLPAGPVVPELTNKQIETAATKAASDRAAAAKAQAAAAAAAAKAYQDFVEAGKEILANLREQNAIESSIYQIKTASGAQADVNAKLFAAQVSAAQALGATIEGGTVELGKAGVQLQFNLETLKAEKNLTDAQVLARRKLIETAIAQAQVNAQTAIQNQAEYNTAAMIADFKTQEKIDTTIIAQIKAGILVSSEAIAKAEADAAFWAKTELEIAQGKLNLTREQIEAMKKANDEAAKGVEKGKEQVKAQEDQMAEWKGKIQDTFGNAFDQAWETGRVSFKQLLIDLAKDLAKSAFLKYLKMFIGGASNGGGWSGGWGAITGQANGGGWANGTQFFAKGGVVNSPTAFGMANNKAGVMGEAGPEAIMPLTRGPNGKLGVQASGVASNSGATLIVSPGAVVINPSGDNGADLQSLSKGIDQLIDTKFSKLMKESQRSGNSLNRNFGYRH